MGLVERELHAGLALDDVGEATGEPAEDSAGRDTHDRVLHVAPATASEVLLHGQRLTATVAGIVDAFLVVFAALDALATQLATVIGLFALVLLAPPLLDGAEHDAAAIPGAVLALVTLRGVVHDTVDDAVQRAVDIDVVVVPGLHELRHDPLEDLGRRAPGDLVQDLMVTVSTTNNLFLEGAG